jgi:hypothetical protein
MVAKIFSWDFLSNGIIPSEHFYKRFIYDHSAALIGWIVVREWSSCGQFNV